jgi:hypothetical protein
MATEAMPIPLVEMWCEERRCITKWAKEYWEDQKAITFEKRCLMLEKMNWIHGRVLSERQFDEQQGHGKGKGTHQVGEHERSAPVTVAHPWKSPQISESGGVA